MKRVLATACFASLMASTAAFALTFNGTNVAGAGVVGSKHNMLKYEETTADSQRRVCAYCHTPHHALADNTGGIANYLPLWSHKITTQLGYVPYDSATLNLSMDNSLKGATILCMSCHDGVIAVDEHYNNGLSANKLTNDGFDGGGAIGLANNVNNVGKANFANDHPIGFSYAEALRKHDGDLNVKTTTWTGSGRTTKVRTIEDVLTGGDFFTCASCHDVHNKDNVDQLAGKNYFLYGSQENSAFCLTCHVK